MSEPTGNLKLVVSKNNGRGQEGLDSVARLLLLTRVLLPWPCEYPSMSSGSSEAKQVVVRFKPTRRSKR